MWNFIKKVPVILLTISLSTPFLLMNTNNAFATTFLIESYNPKVVSDGNGGAYIALSDYKEKKVFIQRVDSSGNFMWEGSGISTPVPIHTFFEIVYDEEGGVIIVWSTPGGLYTQKIDTAGNTLWEGNGVLVYKRTGGQFLGWFADLSVVSDKAGGAIIIWQRLESSHPIFAQKIDNSGKIVWDTNGIIVSPESYDYLEPECVSDGMGGAILVWDEGQEAVHNIFTQRLDKAGNLLWGSSGVQIRTGYSHFKAVSDENSETTIVFNNYNEMSFIRLDFAGKIVWGEGNKVKLDPPGSIYDFQILSDDQGGIFIVWEEAHSGWNFLRNDTNIYTQQIDRLGNLLWGTLSAAICTSNGDERELKIISDGSGGFIVSWEDFRDNSSYIFVQRVNAFGNVMWTKNGTNLGRLYRPIREFKMVSNGAGGAIIIREEGESLEPRVFSQLVDANGVSKEPETSLYPQGLPRDKKDYEALIGSTFIYGGSYQRPIWHLVLWAGIALAIIAIPVVIFIRRKFRRN